MSRQVGVKKSSTIQTGEHRDINKYDANKKRQQISGLRSVLRKQKHVRLHDVEVRRKIDTYCQGETETLSAFSSSFEFVRINRFLCTSLLLG